MVRSDEKFSLLDLLILTLFSMGRYLMFLRERERYVVLGTDGFTLGILSLRFLWIKFRGDCAPGRSASEGAREEHNPFVVRHFRPNIGIIWNLPFVLSLLCETSRLIHISSVAVVVCYLNNVIYMVGILTYSREYVIFSCRENYTETDHITMPFP